MTYNRKTGRPPTRPASCPGEPCPLDRPTYAGRDWTPPAAAGCPDCGRDIDAHGGNPDCPTCAAEPATRS